MQRLNGETRKFYLKNGYISMNTYFYTQKIEGKAFKKFYIVDLRRLTEEEAKSVLKEFATIQDELVKDDFFFKAAQNLYLYFLCDDKSKYKNIAAEAVKDIRYAFKLLINANDLSSILDNNVDIEHVNPEEQLNLNGEHLKIGNFNLIYGGNGSGKTMLLNKIGEHYNVTPHNMMRIGDSSNVTLKDKIYLDAFVSEEEYMYNYFLYLMSIIRMAKNTDTPILLDDFGWNGLDDINQIKIATLLNEASFDNKTFITAPQTKIKSFVRSQIYNPNIIEL